MIARMVIIALALSVSPSLVLADNPSDAPLLSEERAPEGSSAGMQRWWRPPREQEGTGGETTAEEPRSQDSTRTGRDRICRRNAVDGTSNLAGIDQV